MNDKREYLKKFKHQCHSYGFYQGQVEKIDQKIHLLDLRMQNVKSPALEKIGQTPTKHELSYPELITKKEKLLKDKAYYQEHLNWITETINAIPSAAYRSVTWMTYVERKSLHSISKFQALSKDMLYKKRKKFVSYVLTDERMQKLDEIEKAERQKRIS